ncbi:sulfatase-like hydrolase/transferase [Kordiimonas sp.]|uniref:sulfatase-like hydrolase/transferase n=1 Tax=Kordiimonas sp. TaxID=1970157 RepID=UPI003A9069C6
MAPIKDRQSLFEISITIVLISLALVPAFSMTFNLILALGHWLFLTSATLFALEAARRLRPVAGSFLFSIITAILATEILVQQLTGLHLNGFTLSLMFESGWRQNIGLSFTAVLAPVALIAFSFSLARARPRKALRLPLRPMLALTIVGATVSQLAYALLYFEADTHVMETRRKLPFFAALHPYRAEKLLHPFLGDRPLNPFALSRADVASPERITRDLNVTRLRNILMVVADSIRAADIKADPGVAPNIAALAGYGMLSLDHYAASNCTHFSMYSMFTGNLPTAYEAARRAAAPTGLMSWLEGAGYKLSSAEALSLDWYDLSSLLFSPAKRTIASGGTAAERDSFVTETTIEILNQAGEQPFFHLAYYNGAHFPYGDNDPLPGLVGGTPESYRSAVRTTDAEIGKLLEAVKESGRDTLVIVTSDHGESVFEHGTVGHASALTDEQMIVPFGVMGGSNLPLPGGQLGIADFILAELGAEQQQTTDTPTLLSNCSYAFPNGFAVIEDDRRADFLFEDGFLSPVPSPNGTMPPKAFQLEAAQQLVKAINNKASD